jgi:hypothetical protein
MTVALFAVIVAWGFGVNASLHAGVPGTGAVPQQYAPPSIVTVNPDLGLPNAVQLCAQISPSQGTITIESVSGTILSTGRCCRVPIHRINHTLVIWGVFRQ